jgi:hypothetical protein
MAWSAKLETLTSQRFRKALEAAPSQAWRADRSEKGTITQYLDHWLLLLMPLVVRDRTDTALGKDVIVSQLEKTDGGIRQMKIKYGFVSKMGLGTVDLMVSHNWVS